jgi:intracellular sulfur oxidation DsrE/DsrF family protein
MNDKDPYSDEHLNAFIDGELDKPETGQLLDELRYNKQLDERITDLQKIREMVRYAYHEKVPSQNEGKQPLRSPKKSRMALVASVMMLFGTLLGWNLHQQSQSSQGLLEIAEAMQLKAPVSAQQNEIRLMLHVTTDDHMKLETVLNETEKFLDASQQGNRKVKLDILTNGKGLKLLAATHSPFENRIKDLQQRFNNLTFKACQNAINRMQKRTGKELKMLPDTVTVPSALGEVMKKQKEGWSYIKI